MSKSIDTHVRYHRDFLAVACALALGAAAPACRQPPAVIAQGYERAQLEVTRDARRLALFDVEIADDPVKQSVGLMHIRHLAPGTGMIFLFNSPTSVAFYMKDTLIPLDIGFWSDQNRLVDIQAMRPCYTNQCPLYHSSEPFVGAVEVSLGVLAHHGIRPGDRISVILHRPDP